MVCSVASKGLNINIGETPRENHKNSVEQNQLKMNNTTKKLMDKNQYVV